MVLAIRARNFKGVVQDGDVRMAMARNSFEVLEDAQLTIRRRSRDVGTENLQRKVRRRGCIRPNQPDCRGASVAELVDNLVCMLASTDPVANVNRMKTTWEILLDILNVCHDRLAIAEGEIRL